MNSFEARARLGIVKTSRVRDKFEEARVVVRLKRVFAFAVVSGFACRQRLIRESHQLVRHKAAGGLRRVNRSE